MLKRYFGVAFVVAAAALLAGARPPEAHASICTNRPPVPTTCVTDPTVEVIDLSSDEPGPLSPLPDGQIDLLAPVDGPNLATTNVFLTTTSQTTGSGQVAECQFWVTASQDGTRANGYFGIQCNVSANMSGNYYWEDYYTGAIFKSGAVGPKTDRSSYAWYNATYKGRPGKRRLVWCGNAQAREGNAGSCVAIKGRV